MPQPVVSNDELERAVRELESPERFREAERAVTQAAPGLQRVLSAALAEGGWFGSAHEEQIRQAAATDDPEERLAALRALVADDTRLGMFVGVAVGWELARRLACQTDDRKEE